MNSNTRSPQLHQAARLALAGTLAVAVLIALAFVGGVFGGARADFDPDAMASMSIDMDVSSSPANTATSLGSLESCAELTPNGVQDADETAVDTLTFDVTATSIPISAPMLGFTFAIGYDDANLEIRSATVNPQPGSWLLNVLPGSSIYNVNDPVPDSSANGIWTGAAVDTSLGSHEAGTGVLERLTIGPRGTPPNGVYTLVLSPADSAHIDPASNAYFPNALNNARISIGAVCNPTPTPTPIPTSTPTPIPTPTAPPATPTPATVVIAAGSYSPGNFQPFSIPISAQGLYTHRLGVAVVDLLYDPSQLQAIACTADPGGVFGAATCDAAFGPGVVRLADVSLSGLLGSNVVLADVTFQVQNWTQANAVLHPVVGALLDTGNTTMPSTVVDGTVSIPPTPTPAPATPTPAPTPTATPAPTPTATPIPWAKGDLNCDRAINNSDVRALSGYVGGKSVSLPPGCPPISSSGDLNCDAAVNSADVDALKRYIQGKPVALPPGCAAIGS